MDKPMPDDWMIIHKKHTGFAVPRSKFPIHRIDFLLRVLALSPCAQAQGFLLPNQPDTTKNGQKSPSRNWRRPEIERPDNGR
jgi:hypothetical protein